MIRPFRAAAFLAALVVGPAAAPGLSFAESPVHHAIEARLDPASRRLEVRDVVTLAGRAEMSFRLASWLEIAGARVDGRPVDAAGAAGAWRLALPDAGEHEVELRLAGVLPPLGTADGRSAAGDAAAGPEGAFLPGYAAWIPETGDDWIGFRLSVETPAPHRPVATGDLMEEAAGATANRAVFAADYPAAPPSLFAGPYEVQRRAEGGIEIRTWFHPELAGLADAYLGDAARYLARYAEEIGPYPFRDFDIVSAPLPVGLGFPGLTYIGRTVLPLPFVRARSLAHEVLHNWWGNGVAVDFAGGNWSEGLTTYMADYALAAERGAEAAREMRLAWLRDYAALPAERDMAVTGFVAKRHDAARVIGYGKTAFVFHMLRRELGEAAFAEGLRLFWRQQRFRVAGWGDLRRAFELASGRDLGWFFAQWLERAGAPRLGLGATDAESTAGAHRLRLAVRQDPPAYRLTLPVLIETRAGEERTQVEIDGEETTATLTLEAEPLAVHLDPDHDIFRRLLPGEAPPILRDVTLAADAVTVIAAEDEAAARVARRLAGRLLDGPPREGPAERGKLAPAPLLVIGLGPDVERFLARAGMAGVPERLAGRGSARVWTARRQDGEPLLVVAADDAAALEALLRPLPHYGGKSYLVFEGGRATESGVWRLADSPLTRRLAR